MINTYYSWLEHTLVNMSNFTNDYAPFPSLTIYLYIVIDHLHSNTIDFMFIWQRLGKFALSKQVFSFHCHQYQIKIVIMKKVLLTSRKYYVLNSITLIELSRHNCKSITHYNMIFFEKILWTGHWTKYSFKVFTTKAIAKGKTNSNDFTSNIYKKIHEKKILHSIKVNGNLWKTASNREEKKN